MAQAVFFRNSRSSDQLETFLVSGAASLLGIRFYLHITGYPQVGGERLHIAHMLYGGILMAAAVIIALSFLGPRIQRLIAITGGVGFGIFIDELGKFITRDNDYFYEPAIGLIYATFIILYLVIHFLGRTRPLSNRESQVNALWQLQEAAIDDFDGAEKNRVLALLNGADQTSPMTRNLRALLEAVPVVPTARANVVARNRGRVRDWYRRWSAQKDTRRLVQGFFVAESLFFLASVSLVVAGGLGNALDPTSGGPSYEFQLAVAELASSAVAACFVLIGAISFTRSRLQAYEWFRRATLVNIFLTEFFMFTRVQFEALPGFAFNLVLLILIRFAIRQERAVRTASTAEAAAGAAV